MTGVGPLEIIKLAIYYGSWLYVAAAPLALWLAVRRRGRIRWAALGFFTVITCMAYGRFVEPRILLTAERDVALEGCFKEAGALRVAVFSDTHIGLFGNAMPIERIARAVNAAHPDFTLMAGDYIYFLAPERFEAAFGALKEIKSPIFAVLGNHDVGLPGPDLSKPLKETLPIFGVRFIDNRALNLSDDRFDIELVGLSDEWAHRQKLSLLEQPVERPRLVLTHHPSTALEFRPGMSADLMIAGHTHGGQIQLPLLTCVVTGVCGDKAYGLREARDKVYTAAGASKDALPIGLRDISKMLIFTTSGTGMVGLPMRFRAPPRVDVLNIRYKACATD